MKKLISYILIPILLFSSLSLTVIAESDATTPTETRTELEVLQEEYDRLEAEILQGDTVIKALTAADKDYLTIDAINMQTGKISEQIDNIKKQKQILSKEIESIEKQISETEEELTRITENLKVQKEELNELVDKYCQKLRTKYIYGDITILHLISDDTDLQSFFNKTELITRLEEEDAKLISQLHEEIDNAEASRVEAEAKKESLDKNKTELKDKDAQLKESEKLLKEKKETILKKSVEINRRLVTSEYMSNLNNINKNAYSTGMSKAEGDIDNYLKDVVSNFDSTSEKWLWPVPYNTSYISSPYGYRNDPITGVYKFHSGIDITLGGAMGKDIVATKSGIVIKVVHSNSGYGNYIIVDHGDGWCSLYAHCRTTFVSVGQEVGQGQRIAQIGTSGYSTGPHLHFEIRHNNQKVNPMNYLQR